jgi:hypothetical protein
MCLYGRPLNFIFLFRPIWNIKEKLELEEIEYQLIPVI